MYPYCGERIPLVRRMNQMGGRGYNLEVSDVVLFGEWDFLEAERIHNIVDRFSTIRRGFLLFLSGRIGTLRESITSLVEGRDRIDRPISTSAPSLTVTIWQSTS